MFLALCVSVDIVNKTIIDQFFSIMSLLKYSYRMIPGRSHKMLYSRGISIYNANSTYNIITQKNCVKLRDSKLVL